MKIKALVSFSGKLSMYKGEILEYGDDAVLQDLFKAGFITEVRKSEKEVKTDESKRDQRA